MSANEEFVARDYQNVLAQQAIERNSILFLPTGSGKTYIAIMTLKHLFNQLTEPFDNGGKRAVFLVNTVALVEQQADVIKRHVQVQEVGRYSGDMNLDNWSKEVWLAEFRAFEVLVMTAEIMLQLLLKKYIKFEQLALMILDECHHAVEDHPMRQMMKLLEDCPLEDQPRVIGLTATLLNSNPKSIPKVTEDVKKLEVTLHSTVATVNSWELVKKFSTKPREKIIPFQPNQLADSNIVVKLVDKMVKFCEHFNFNPDQPQGILEPGFKHLRMAKKKSIKNLILQVSKQCGSLGLYGSYKTVLAVSVTLNIAMLREEDIFVKLAFTDLLTTLSQILKSLDSQMVRFREINQVFECTTPKVLKLLNILVNHNYNCEHRINGQTDPLRALVFVQERMTAKILCSLLKNAARKEGHEFIRAEFIVGHTFDPLNESWEAAVVKKNNAQVVKRFREGEVNVLVCSDVLEEGIDITLCNMVVKFDEVLSFRSYIQSKGRARHTSSLFRLFSEVQKCSDLEKKVDFYNLIEKRLIELLVGKTDDRESPTEEELNELYGSDELPPYETPSGAKVTMTSAISLMNGYTMTLSRDRFSQFKPLWGVRDSSPYITVSVKLPKISPFQDTVKSPAMTTLKSARRAAALEMCKNLHQSGELDDHLLPKDVALSSADFAALFPLWKDEDGELKPGTKSQTRDYPIYKPDCLKSSGTKGIFYIHPIEMTPVSAHNSATDSATQLVQSLFLGKRCFAVISSTEIPEVGCFPVFFKFGEIQVYVRSRLSCNLTDQELKEIEQYHYRLFTSVVPIAKSFTYFKLPENNQRFLITPVIRDGLSVVIDWNTMRSGMKDSRIEIPEECLGCVVRPCHRSFSPSDIFIVTSVSKEVTAHSKFPNANFKDFVDYYKKKYNYTVTSPKLPLLQVVSSNIQSDTLLPRQTGSCLGEHFTQHFPPELCVKKDGLDSSVFVQAILLPSLLHRYERLLVANDLRHRIARETGIGVLNLPLGQKWKSLECPNSRQIGVEVKVSEIERLAVAWKETHSAVQSTKPQGSSNLFPWGESGSEIDVDRHFETVTIRDLRKFCDFASKKMSISSSPYRVENKPINLPNMQKDIANPIIKCLKANSATGPHPCHIFEAITASSSNDIVDYERFETLGDSFLKFAVSLFLFEKFPELSEGHCTQVKGKLLGNRNLFYCAREKSLANFLKTDKMVVWDSFYPPHFSVPAELRNSVEDIPGRIHNLKSFLLSEDERREGRLDGRTLFNFNQLKSDAVAKSLPPAITGAHRINDKCVADTVEALLGCYLETCGPQASFELLEWFKILPEFVTENTRTRDILKPHISSELVFSSKKSGGFDRVSNQRLLESILGYVFKNSSLLLEAVTHSSFPGHQNSYERLEFLGDALLDFLITSYIFENCGRLSPGELTDLRSALVNNITFACLTVRNGFHKFMLCASATLFQCVDRFAEFQEGRNHVIDDEVLILLEEDECKLAETVDVPKALGDIFEAIVGAIFLDCGRKLDVVWGVIYRLMKNEINAFSKSVPKQVVRRLYETFPHGIQFRSVTEKSLIVQTMVELSLTLNDETRKYNGFGENKAQAKKSAAKLALKDLKFHSC